MPEHSEPPHFFSTVEMFTYTVRPVPPDILVLNAADDSFACYFGSLDNLTCHRLSAAPADVVIDPSQPKPYNPENPPTSADR